VKKTNFSAFVNNELSASLKSHVVVDALQGALLRGSIPLTLQISFHSFSASVIEKKSRLWAGFSSITTSIHR
jgi:hypothetical protein